MVTDSLMLGYGATYAGAYAFTRASATAPLLFSDDYWLHNAAVTWTVSDSVSVQLDIENLTDQTYYNRVQSELPASAGPRPATPGRPRLH